MRPGIDVITLAVDDLERSLRFYRDALGLTATDGITGTEFLPDDVNPAGAVVMFKLEAGLTLALHPRTDLAKDAGIAPAPSQSGSFSIGHLVDSRTSVDELLDQARASGGRVSGGPRERPWGIYSGYFHDPDGHLWEVIWNPPRGGTSS